MCLFSGSKEGCDLRISSWHWLTVSAEHIVAHPTWLAHSNSLMRTHSFIELGENFFLVFGHKINRIGLSPLAFSSLSVFQERIVRCMAILLLFANVTLIKFKHPSLFFFHAASKALMLTWCLHLRTFIKMASYIQRIINAGIAKCIHQSWFMLVRWSIQIVALFLIYHSLSLLEFNLVLFAAF